VTEPLVSILIPTYNGERFLRPALRSAMEQTYKNLEILVGDDASTDRTPEIIRAAEATDPRVRGIRYPQNIGAFENPVHLLREAQGEYVKYLLHDDVLHTDCVRRLVRGMQATPDATLAFSRRVLINEEGRTRPDGELPALRDAAGLVDGRELGNIVLEACHNIIGELTTVLFRRTDVHPADLWQVDGRRVDCLNDVQLFLMLLSRGPAYYEPQALSRFRLHQGQNGSHPDLVGQAERDWSRLIDWAARNGFLAGERQERRAQARALLVAANRVALMVETDLYGAALEAAFLSTARLLELRGPGSPAAAGLTERAHGPAVLRQLGQELDVWTRLWPVALAAPIADVGALHAAEVTATVRALREVDAAGVAEKLMLAVPGELVDAVVPLVEAELENGPDVDIELVPTDDPGALFRSPWLAVAPRSGRWFNGHATALWSTTAPSPEVRHLALRRG
jgi:glycosyltransferase involved in cell wall biosynthesis